MLKNAPHFSASTTKEKQTLAIHKSTIKRARQSEKRKQRNKSALSTMKTMVKKVYTSMEGKESQEITESLRVATSYIDKIADKGIIHKNKAGRIVSRLTARANSTGGRQ